jgi:hypothetical protein
MSFINQIMDDLLTYFNSSVVEIEWYRNEDQKKGPTHKDPY